MFCTTKEAKRKISGGLVKSDGYLEHLLKSENKLNNGDKLSVKMEQDSILDGK